MSTATTISIDYWENFQLTNQDIEFLYNYLLEVEIPLTSSELLTALVDKRIETEKAAFEKSKAGLGLPYLPKSSYTVGDRLVFPALDWSKGKVVSIRQGFNPDIASFKVMDVEFSDGVFRSFGFELSEHILNQTVSNAITEPNLDSQTVLETYGSALIFKLEASLSESKELVQIAGRWFPRALLVDVNIGYLNLAEALLDEQNGGPLPTSSILKSIELPTDTNLKLTEFSLNLALQEDERFDEVGPSGEVLWFLHRLEPKAVLTQPLQLAFGMPEYDFSSTANYLSQLSPNIMDELEPLPSRVDSKFSGEVTLVVIYPHWRSGTLPLADSIARLIPSAYKSPRVLFTFVDGNNGKKFGGWVVRSLNMSMVCPIGIERMKLSQAV